MNNYDLNKVKYIFARLFVVAIQNMVHPQAFTKALEKSTLIKKIEDGKYDDYFNKSVLEVFKTITGNVLSEDNGFGIYNDAYWCGAMYFDLFVKTHKPFSYLFLKLPFEKMLDIYEVYHEMDFSSLLMYFQQCEKEKTILRTLVEEKHISLSKLSKATGININTLMKYNASDEALYRGSFQNIVKIATFFEAPISLFQENTY